jgi:hypothetical protein
MKKQLKRLFTLLVSAALCAGLCVPALALNENNTLGIEFYANLDTYTLYVSDQDQTVNLSIDLSQEYYIDSMEFIIGVDSTFSVAKPTDLPDGYSSYGEKLHKIAWMNQTSQLVSYLGKAAITIPANTPAGDYEITVTGIKLSHERTYWEKTATCSATLTIVDPNAPVDATGAQGGTVSLAKDAAQTLTAALLPAETTDTVASYSNWNSDAPEVATVSDGVVTGVAAGTAHVTATVTTAAGKTFEAAWTVNVVASRYTVTIADDTAGVAEVAEGGSVSMTVAVSGGDYNAVQSVVTYDPSLFTYTGGSSDSGASVVLRTEGNIKIEAMSTSLIPSGTVLATLNFKAADAVDATTTGVFHVKAQACTFDEAYTQDALDAAAVTDSVKIVKAYTVKFQDQTGADMENASYSVLDGGKLTQVPAAPAVEHYTFDKWQNTATGDAYTADELKELAVTGDVTYKATYKADTVSVDLADGITGDSQATYGQDYTATVDDPDNDNYTYTATYTVNGGEEKTVDVAEDGTFTVPGADVTGDLAITYEKTLKNVTVNVYNEYVTGYTLVTVSGNSGTVYSYNGSAMYYVDSYSAYAWLAAGKLTQEQAAACVDVATASAAGTVTATYDVNLTGTVDFNDKATVFGCYNVAGENSVENEMALYLRADVNHDYAVNADDVSAVGAQFEY